MKGTKIAATSLCFGLFVLAVFPLTIVAQGLFGTISGVVTDSSGAVVVGATVKVTNVDTNVSKTVATNTAGVYNAASLNPGGYKIEAEAQGFKKALISAITLEVNANRKVNVILEV